MKVTFKTSTKLITFNDNNNNNNHHHHHHHHHNDNNNNLQSAISISVLPRRWKRWGGTRKHNSKVMDGAPQANF